MIVEGNWADYSLQLLLVLLLSTVQTPGSRLLWQPVHKATAGCSQPSFIVQKALLKMDHSATATGLADGHLLLVHSATWYTHVQPVVVTIYTRTRLSMLHCFSYISAGVISL